MVAALLAVGAAGCNGSSDSPTTLPPISTTPAPTQTSAPPQSPKDAVAAVVHDYYRLLNAASTLRNADSLARLMTPNCPCRRVVQATRSAARKSERYFGTNHIVSVTPTVDARDSAEALVQYDYTDGGIKDASGKVITRTQGRVGNLVRFILTRQAESWLIARIDILKNGHRA